MILFSMISIYSQKIINYTIKFILKKTITSHETFIKINTKNKKKYKSSIKNQFLNNNILLEYT